MPRAFQCRVGLHPQPVRTDPSDGAGIQEDRAQVRRRRVDRPPEDPEQSPERLLDPHGRLAGRTGPPGRASRCRAPVGGTRTGAVPTVGWRLRQPRADAIEDIQRRCVPLRVEDHRRPAVALGGRHRPRHARRGRLRAWRRGPSRRARGAAPAAGGPAGCRSSRAARGRRRSPPTGRTRRPRPSLPAAAPAPARRSGCSASSACAANARSSRRNDRPRTGALHNARSSIGAPWAIAWLAIRPPSPSPMAATRVTPGWDRSQAAAADDGVRPGLHTVRVGRGTAAVAGPGQVDPKGVVAIGGQSLGPGASGARTR